MTDDPFLQLVCDALGLMNRAFTDPADRHSYAAEFYHQFRKMWDRGIPVGMGLGHLILTAKADGELFAYRHGENGRPHQPVAVIHFWGKTPPDYVGYVTGDLDAHLRHRKQELGCPVAVAVDLTDPDPQAIPSDEYVTLRFDPARWTVTVFEK